MTILHACLTRRVLYAALQVNSGYSGAIWMSLESEQEETEFYPVWISSIEHLETFASIFQGLTKRSLFTRGYDIPPGFPKLDMPFSNYFYVFLVPASLLFAIHELFYTPSSLAILWTGLFIYSVASLAITLRSGSRGVPLTFLSNGELRFERGEIVFVACPYKTFGVKYLNLALDLEFRLKPSDIEQITRYEQPRLFPFGPQSAMNWIRIIINENDLGGDFLLSVSGRGFRAMKRITERNDSLYKIIIDFKEGISGYIDSSLQTEGDTQSESELEGA
jgi:hypothetical protein